jgi:hypothetical protein
MSGAKKKYIFLNIDEKSHSSDPCTAWKGDRGLATLIVVQSRVGHICRNKNSKIGVHL